MNVKLVDLLLDDVRTALHKHIGSLGFQIVDRHRCSNVGSFSIRKKVKYLWGFLSCYKTIGEIRYSLSPYMNVDLCDVADFNLLEKAFKVLEKDLRGRGFLDSYSGINVNIGRNL